MCYVVANPGSELGEAAVNAHCAESLPSFKRPKAVLFTESLPKSDRGKIKRDALRDMWIEANNRPGPDPVSS